MKLKPLSFVKFPALVLLYSILSIYSCSTGEKLHPMKLCPQINIPDGEFLHYTLYSGGEKDFDYYYITEKITNGRGNNLYRTYLDIVPAAETDKLSFDYRKWPVFFVIDPRLGSVIESAGNIKPGMIKSRPRGSFWHYLLDREKGEAFYQSKSVNGGKTNESKSIIKFNTDIPSMDMWGQQLFAQRFIDYSSGGIFYSIVPEAMKGPMPFTCRYVSKETIRTKAGCFRVNKVNFILADPFISKLLEVYLKTSMFMVEDSDRRLAIKAGMLGEDVVLEEISNIRPPMK